jgi:hypothetical protein
MDPLEFRRKNILADGRPQATGTIMQDAAIGKVLDAIAERMNWQAPFDRGSGTLRRRRGLGLGFKASISPTTSGAIVNVSADGSVVLYTNTVDMGQGSDTAMAQIVAETLDIKTEDGIDARVRTQDRRQLFQFSRRSEALSSAAVNNDRDLALGTQTPVNILATSLTPYSLYNYFFCHNFSRKLNKQRRDARLVMYRPDRRREQRGDTQNL